jgi:uncharacterized membrane protein YjdF
MADDEEKPNRLQRLAKHVPSLGMLLILVYSQISTMAKLVVKLVPSMHPIMIVISRQVSARSSTSKSRLTFDRLERWRRPQIADHDRHIRGSVHAQ